MSLRPPGSEIARVVSGVLRALPICAPATLAMPEAALAQSGAPARLAADIPAEPLAQALAAFAHQTGLQLVYISRVVQKQRSHAVSKGLSADAALARLLKGTGLKFEYLTPRSVRIVASVPAPRRSANTSAGGGDYEVIITAHETVENYQDVPVTVQAIGGEELERLSISNFDDLLRFIPNVTSNGTGPGASNIFIRGLGSVSTGTQSQSTIGAFPNVALYLDEQSMQFPARNNDVYLVDMARVEVLEGPQGVLLGGGAEAGAVRYVTNKPTLSATTGELNAGYGVTAHGDPNDTLNAVLNVPLISDALAVRAVLFTDHRGGYIDNVPATIAYLPASNAALLGGNPSANNGPLVGAHLNPLSYGGARLSALWQIDNDWSLLLQQNYQHLEADGYFASYPVGSDGALLQPLEITAFEPAYTKDRYESTAWTLTGGVGDLSAVYAGSYMVRHIQAQQDYSNYMRSVAGAYYGCIGPGAGYFNPSRFSSLSGMRLQCYPPVATWNDTVEHQHQSHELRLSTSQDRRLRVLVGGFWEKFVIDDQMNFNYLTIPQCDPANLAAALAGGPDCLSAVGPLPGSFATDPALRTGVNNAFGEDVQRGYKQLAFFASFDFDLIPKVLTLSGGTRWYRYNEFEEGSEWYTQSTTSLILNHPNGTCTAAGLCGFPLNLSKSESGTRSRADLTWHLTPEVMAYYTFSQGFRPGGFNRVNSPLGEAAIQSKNAPYCGTASTDPRCQPGGSLYDQNTSQYLEPPGYGSDTLVNNELGIKNELLSHHLLLNASAYFMQWNNVQAAVFDPQYFGSSTYNTNGPSYSIRGLELQAVARVGEGLTLQGSTSWNRARQTTAPCLESVGVTPLTPNNPTPAGECIAIVRGLPFTSPFPALGTAPPYSPPAQFNVRARYDWNGEAYKPFALIAASHVASMQNDPANFPAGNGPGENPPTTTYLRYPIPGYTTWDAALGVTRDSWTVAISGSNLANSSAATNISDVQFIRSEIPLRPRVLMAQLSYRF